VSVRCSEKSLGSNTAHCIDFSTDFSIIDIRRRTWMKRHSLSSARASATPPPQTRIPRPPKGRSAVDVVWIQVLLRQLVDYVGDPKREFQLDVGGRTLDAIGVVGPRNKRRRHGRKAGSVAYHLRPTTGRAPRATGSRARRSVN